MIIYKFADSSVTAATNVNVLSRCESPITMHPTGSIQDLPGILGMATSWLVCKELWPDRVAPDASTAEIHLAVHADHSFSVINDQCGSHREVGIFRGMLYAQPPGPLTWLRPHSACSVEYVGLRWVVPREDLLGEISRIARGLTELTGDAGNLI